MSFAYRKTKSGSILKVRYYGQRLTSDSRPRARRYPQKQYVDNVLGSIGDRDTENQFLLLEHDVPHHGFSDAVLSCLPPEGKCWTIPEEEFKCRTDLRKLNICSVDPPGCTDIDDALHYKDIDKETCEVGVHIADVSYYVKPDTPLDREAANRGTTVYLSDRRIDMIPELLSSNLCSLIEHQDRLAFSAIWKIRKSDAHVIDVQFMRSIIRSKASLTYEKAQSMIDDKQNHSVLHTSLRGLNSLAKKLKQRRLERGALVLARGEEIRFVECESETHERDASLEIQHKKMVETNSMVEEFMLLANIAVATKLLEVFPERALLRRHPRPSKANFDELIESAQNRGFDIETESGKSLSESLDKARITGNDYFNVMLRMIATRCMTPAAYFCSGSIDSEVTSYCHFGLAADLYTHFTSPIRRYADLLVHRLLAHAINCSRYGFDKTLLSVDILQSVCEHINYRHRMAQLASRASARLHTVLYIKSKRHLIEDAYVFFVRQNAIQIFIPKLAYEFTYFLKPAEDWKYNSETRTQTNVRNNVTIKQFDQLKVEISVSTQENLRYYEKIDFKIIEPRLDTSAGKDIDKSKDSALITTRTSFDHDIQFVEADAHLRLGFDEDDEIRKISYPDVRKRTRLDLSETEQDSKPVIVMPGDDLSKYIKKDTTMLGPGLMRNRDTVVATKSGILKMRNNNLFWIDNHQKRYVAARGECVIGVVRFRGSMHVRVDINAADLASLSMLAFEGATKRNKPNLNEGDLVYAKVVSASKHVETELVCVNSNGKRDGLGVIGDKGGMLVDMSIDSIRVLLSPKCDLLHRLGQLYRYEIALGMNGRVWVYAETASTTILLVNELRKFDLCS